MAEIENHTGQSFKNGVNLSHIPAFEVFFKVSINIYSLQEDGSCEVVYLSRLSYSSMYLNLYKTHFSFISKIDSYSKRYQCMMCESIFDRVDNLKRHTRVCCTDIKESYNGGKLKPPETIFDWLEKEGINVPKEDRFYKFVSVYDYEAIQIKSGYNLKGRDIKATHVPASFSLCSNIPNHTAPIHEVSDGNTQLLIDKVVLHQLNHQKAASVIMRKKFDYVIDKIRTEIDQIEEANPDITKKLILDKEHYVCRRYKKMTSLLASVLKYCDQLIILGFNSQRYDIPLIRRYLPSSLKRLDSLPNFVIKKTNSYMALSTKSFKYLDLTNYLAAGTSLDSFYKAYNVSTPKACFAYEWFDSLEKLDYTGLPTQSQFRSSLRNKGIDAETYMACWRVWNTENMKTFADYVKFYNNHDVLGFVQGLEKFLAIENEQGLDVFKESVSLASLREVSFIFFQGGGGGANVGGHFMTP